MGLILFERDRDEGLIVLLTANPTVITEEPGFFDRFFTEDQEDGEIREVVLTVSLQTGFNSRSCGTF